MRDESAKNNNQLKYAVWQKQLYLEYRRICQTYSLSLKGALIKVSASQALLGIWDAKLRSITISTALIESCSWDVVIEVLKHEVAHQIVSERYQQVDGHGPVFQQACELIAVAPWARASQISLDQLKNLGKEHFHSEFERSLMRRAKKLLALAESSNQNEAFIAMKKVQQLYETYHIEHLCRKEESQYVSVMIGHKKKRIEAYQSMIASLLVRHFYVRIIHTSLYSAEDCKEYKVLEVLGAKHHVEMAEYVYWFLYNHIQIFWKEFKKSNPSKSLAARNNYFQGVVSGFDERLLKSKKNRESGTGKGVVAAQSQNTLILLEQESKRLKQFVGHKFPSTKVSYTSSSSKPDYSSFSAGKAKGRNLVLHRGVEDKKSFSGRLLNPSRK